MGRQSWPERVASKIPSHLTAAKVFVSLGEAINPGEIEESIRVVFLNAASWAQTRNLRLFVPATNNLGRLVSDGKMRNKGLFFVVAETSNNSKGYLEDALKKRRVKVGEHELRIGRFLCQGGRGSRESSETSQPLQSESQVARKHVSHTLHVKRPAAGVSEGDGSSGAILAGGEVAALRVQVAELRTELAQLKARVAEWEAGHGRCESARKARREEVKKAIMDCEHKSVVVLSMSVESVEVQVTRGTPEEKLQTQKECEFDGRDGLWDSSEVDENDESQNGEESPTELERRSKYCKSNGVEYAGAPLTQCSQSTFAYYSHKELAAGKETLDKNSPSEVDRIADAYKALGGSEGVVSAVRALKFLRDGKTTLKEKLEEDLLILERGGQKDSDFYEELEYIFRFSAAHLHESHVAVFTVQQGQRIRTPWPVWVMKQMDEYEGTNKGEIDWYFGSRRYFTVKESRKSEMSQVRNGFGPLQLALRPLEEIINCASIDNDSVSLGLEL